MLEIPTLAELRAQAQGDVEVEINGSLRARLRQAIAYALAAQGYGDLKTLQYLSRQLFVDTADDAFVLLWASVFGINPNPATAASGPVKATGDPGAAIGAGEVLEREDGAQFTVDAPVVIPPVGEVTLSVTATNDWVGEVGNTAAGETLTFASPPANVDPTVTVLSPGIENGFEAETIDVTRDRTLSRIRAQNLGGSEDDYENWAESIAGIAKAYARGSYAGIGTVLVIVTKFWDPTDPLDSPIPSAALITEVEDYINTQKPAGLHLVAIQPPGIQDLDPFIVLDPDTPDVRDTVTRSLALALAEVPPGELARYDDLVLAIDRAAGEEHHRLFVDDGMGNFGPYDTQVGVNNVLVPGTITWTEPP